MNRRSIRAGLFVAATTLAVSGPARADDVVWLKNGGRLRGQVLSEDPKEGVKIKLADGRTRTVPVAEVNKVEYDDAGAAAPPVPTPPAAPTPTAPPPPPVEAPKFGSVAIDAEEAGQVWFDGGEVGLAPFHMDKVPVGSHEVRIDFDAGGSAKGTVRVEEGRAASLRLAPDADEMAFRPRRGASFGMSLDGVFIYPAKTNSHFKPHIQAAYGGGRLSAFVNIGVHPVVDLRVGAYGTGAAGAYGAKLFPFGAFVSTALHASQMVVNVGLQGGYAPGDEVRAWSSERPRTFLSNVFSGMGSIATLGGHVGLGVALGADRRWELALRQEFAGVLAGSYGDGSVPAASPVWVSTTSIGVTVLFLGRGRAAAPSTPKAKP